MLISIKKKQSTDQSYQFGQQQSPEPALPPPAHQSYQNLSGLGLDASSLAPDNAAFVPTSDSPNRGQHHREHLYGGTTSNNNDSTNIFAVNYNPPAEFALFDSMGNALASDGEGGSNLFQDLSNFGDQQLDNAFTQPDVLNGKTTNDFSW
ncbi:hypothetical protein DBV05_g8830 [Lasiodiplodia theobromae]|uniref:Uncharacterized protein n=1 Tax=Lasiodiplodia theobromae TaxID=45133 RepID=A0A5N5D494_9PEZI|nr:hypothetical protein DBV05_g8830 [Lasiodiplodia theobromae]